MNAGARRGFSLLEVLLATGMLIGSAIVLMELASISNRHSAAARDLSKSQLVCQSKLNEILCGLAPVEAVRPTELEDDPRWIYWVEVRPAEQSGLVVLEVGAAHQPIPKKQTARFTLVRWMRDPSATAHDSDAPPPDDGFGPAGVAQGGGFVP